MASRRRFKKVGKIEQGFKIHIQTISLVEKKRNFDEANGEDEN